MKNEERESFCSTCGEFVFSFIKNTTETFHVRGIDITITSPARICENCGEIIFDEVFDDEKLKFVYRVYREQKGLLQPEEIRAIRERRNLTQEECSKILGFNVARYENGSLQSEEGDKRLVRFSQAVFFLRNCRMAHRGVVLLLEENVCARTNSP